MKSLSVVSFVAVFLLVSAQAWSMGPSRHVPGPTPPAADKTALQCADIYLETAPYLDGWKGEVREHCYYSNFCYFHGGLHITAAPDKAQPGSIRVDFGGSARLRMDYCGSLFCEQRKIGHSWHHGTLVIPVAHPEQARFERYDYRRKDLWGDKSSSRTDEQPYCQWVQAHAVKR